MTSPIQGQPGEIHELARYEVRPESLEICLAAIHEFVAYVREHEAGAPGRQGTRQGPEPRAEDEAHRMGQGQVPERDAHDLAPRSLHVGPGVVRGRWGRGRDRGHDDFLVPTSGSRMKLATGSSLLGSSSGWRHPA